MQFSYKNGKIVYAAYVPDARWGYMDYSELRIIDITNGTQQTLTKRTKYFSPDISEDGKKVIAADVSTNTKSFLHILDAGSGAIIKVVPNPDHLFYTYPKFYGDTKIISAVRNSSGKMSLAFIDQEMERRITLLHFHLTLSASHLYRTILFIFLPLMGRTMNYLLTHVPIKNYGLLFMQPVALANTSLL